MRNAIATAAAIALTFTAGSMLADESDKKTTITINESVLVPGKQLPPGKYVMKLADSQSNRNIVQIYNEDESELQAMFIAFPNNKLERDEETVITFWETPAGVPPAIRAWFWPGDTWGQEFAYPKELAQQIAAANNNAEVPQSEGITESELARQSGGNAESAAKQGEAISQGAEPQQAERQAERSETSAALETQPQSQEPGQSQDRGLTTEPGEPGFGRNDTPDLLAQNAPAPQVPEQREPQPGVNDDPNRQAPANQPADQGIGEVDELPRTASPAPWILLTGIMAVAAALMLRRVSRANG